MRNAILRAVPAIFAREGPPMLAFRFRRSRVFILQLIDCDDPGVLRDIDTRDDLT